MIPIIAGLISYIQDNLGVVVWDGEVPRYSVGGDPIAPGATMTTPPTWPVIVLKMSRSGFSRSWTFEDPYDDRGSIVITVWATSRSDVEDLVNRIEALFASCSNWFTIPVGGDPRNPNFVFKMLLSSWYIGQEEGARTQLGEFLYTGEMNYECDMHGAISTS